MEQTPGNIETSGSDFLPNLREHMQQGELRVGGATTDDLKEEAELVAELGSEQMNQQLDAVRALISFFTQRIDWDIDLEQEFNAGYEAKLRSLTIAADRAKRKGLIDTSVVELSADQLDLMLNTFAEDYRRINGVLASDGVLRKRLFEDNPVLYFTAEKIKSLSVRYPHLTEGQIFQLTLGSPASALRKAEDISQAIERLMADEEFVDVPKAYISRLAFRYPVDTEENIRKYRTDVEAIMDSHPDYKRHLVMQLCLNAGRDNRASYVEGKMDQLRHLTEAFPDVPIYIIQRAARAYEEPEKRLTGIIRKAADLVESFPEIGEGQAIYQASVHNNPMYRVGAALELTERLHAENPDVPKPLIRQYALVRDLLAVPGIVSGFMQKFQELSAQKPHLSKLVAMSIVNAHPENYLERAEQFDREFEEIRTKHSESLPDYAVTKICILYRSPVPVAEVIVTNITMLAGEFPDLPQWALVSAVLDGKTYDEAKMRIEGALALVSEVGLVREADPKQFVRAYYAASRHPNTFKSAHQRLVDSIAGPIEEIMAEDSLFDTSPEEAG